MKNNESIGTDMTAGCLMYLVSLPFCAAIRGFVLDKMWTWFVFPVFAIGSPGIIGCVGLSLLLNLASGDRKSSPSDPDESHLKTVVSQIVKSVFTSLIVLTIGFVAHAIQQHMGK